MSFSTPDLDLPGMVAVAARYGYAGIEPRLEAHHAHGVEIKAPPDRRREIRQLIDDSPIAFACLATSCRYVAHTVNQEAVEATLRCIDLAADVGAPCIRVFGGRLTDGLAREEAIEVLAESLSLTAGHAGERGITVCLETHDDWCDPQHVAKVLRQVNHDAIAVNWDIMHPVRQGHATVDKAFRVLQPWIRHVHLHDGVTEEDKLRFVPIGTGSIDHRRAIELLESISFEGFLSGEWIDWEPYEKHLPREAATIRAYLSDRS